MKVRAWAKLNLCLHVLPPKDKNGLYDVNFVNCQLSLFDEISLKKMNLPQPKGRGIFFPRKNSFHLRHKRRNICSEIKGKIEVSCQYQDICHCEKADSCRQQKNLIIRVAQILKQEFGQPALGVEISVQKNIPPASGLAGGSADAAAVLQGLNKIWKLNLGKKQLLKVAGQLGMDSQYCLVGGLAQVSGRKGEKIKPLNWSLPRLWLVIVTPEQEKPSTAWAYQNLKINKIGKSLKKFKLLKQAIKIKNLEGICQNLHNDFESLMMEKFSVVAEIKQRLLKYGAIQVILAGSGLSTVGFFKAKYQAQKAYNKLNKIYKKCFLGGIYDH